MNEVVPPSLMQSNSHGIPLRGAACDRAQGGYGKGVLYCIAATVSFGLMFPVMASALTRVDPFTFTSLRYLLAAGASLVLLRVKEGPGALRPKGEPIALAWFLGSIGFAGFGFLVFLGQQLAGREGALTASIMAATQPLLGVLINSTARRVQPPPYTLLLVLLSFSGVALVITKGDISGLLHEPSPPSADRYLRHDPKRQHQDRDRRDPRAQNARHHDLRIAAQAKRDFRNNRDDYDGDDAAADKHLNRLPGGGDLRSRVEGEG
jgi:hypothetical protein